MNKVSTITEMRAVWKRAGQTGGRQRAKSLSKRRRSEIARSGGLARAKAREPKAA